MCGILGAIGPDIRTLDLETISGALSHRGPDAQHFHSRNNVYLGHSRLSIIDLKGGGQPMESPDRKLVITFNGEVYNYLGLKHELESCGCVFRTNSDTEVLLNAYAQWGKDCLNRLRGMFAFAIADYGKQKLFIARDQLGIKPLVYTWLGNHFSFSSETQALNHLPWVKNDLEPNPQSIYELLRFGYVSAPNSAYRGIFKLPPAHYLEIDMAEPGCMKAPVRYWELIHNPDESLSAQDCMELTDQVIRESVNAHLVSDVPFGVFLSGGLDSTLVASYMSDILREPVRSFSIGFEVETCDERAYARTAASQLGTQHFEEVVSNEGVSLLPQLIRHYGEPFGDSSAVPTWYVSRLARKHVPMVLSGDGGDEFFAGYNKYGAWLTHQLGAERAGCEAKWKHLARLVLARVLPQKYLFQSSGSPFDYWMDISGFFNSRQISSLFKPEFLEQVRLYPDGMQRAMLEVRGQPELTRARHSDIHNYLPGAILTKVDIASMMHGLEVRTPLTDIRVAELSAKIPWDKLMAKNSCGGEWEGKLPFRKLLSTQFDDAFINRAKKGFGPPIAPWLFDDPAQIATIEDRLLSTESGILKWCHRKIIKSIVDRRLGFQTWNLLVLEEWLRQNNF